MTTAVGGIRTPEAVAGWFASGVSRVVIGTAALKDPEFVKEMAREQKNARVTEKSAQKSTRKPAAEPDSMMETVVKSTAFKDFMRTAAREIARGMFGSGRR